MLEMSEMMEDEPLNMEAGRVGGEQREKTILLLTGRGWGKRQTVGNNRGTFESALNHGEG